MKIEKPSVFEYVQEPGIEGIYKAVEYAGRTCYNSIDKIADGSAQRMVNNLLQRKHGSPLEFGTVYLVVRDYLSNNEALKKVGFYSNNKYSIFNMDIRFDDNGKEILDAYITTNLRVLSENNLMDDLKLSCDTPQKYHEKRRFFVITEDRGVMAEFTRHRAMSHCVQSTRYCNYSHDKYGNEITVIEPLWLYGKEDTPQYQEWYNACQSAQDSYFRLLEGGWKPEEARAVLPNSLKTIHCMCGFETDWNHFFDLRCAHGAHPQARELAKEMFKIIYGVYPQTDTCCEEK